MFGNIEGFVESKENIRIKKTKSFSLIFVQIKKRFKFDYLTVAERKANIRDQSWKFILDFRLTGPSTNILKTNFLYLFEYFTLFS